MGHSAWGRILMKSICGRSISRGLFLVWVALWAGHQVSPANFKAVADETWPGRSQGSLLGPASWPGRSQGSLLGPASWPGRSQGSLLGPATWHPLINPQTVIQAGSALDFSHLVEEGPAGKHGRVVVGPGGCFAFANKPGSEIRFFGYDSLVPERSFNEKGAYYLENPMAAPNLEGEHQAIDLHVQAIRRQGYNLLRLQGLDMILSSGATGDGQLNATNLERLDYLISALKKAGIYITLDLAYHNGFLKGRWDEADQRFLRERFLLDPACRPPWAHGARALLTHVNPYTGLSLANDPVLVTLTLWNEQDLVVEKNFFQNPAIKPLANLRWREYLQKKYAQNFEALKTSWEDATDGAASFDDLVFEKAYPGEYSPRGNDAGLFVCDLQLEMARWYQQEVRQVGYPGLTHVFDVVVRFRNQVARQVSPVVAMHTYHNHPTAFNTPGAKMPQNGAIQNGGFYWRVAASARYLDRPLFVTENNFPYWGKYRHEAGLLYPAYSAFQGFAGLTLHCQPVVMTLAYPMGAFFAGRDPVQRANQVLATLLYARGDVRPSTRAVGVALKKEFLEISNAMQKKMSDDQSRTALLCRFGLLPNLPQPTGLPPMAPPDLILPPETGGEIALTGFAAGAGEGAPNKLGTKWVNALREKGILSPSNKTQVEKGLYQSDTGELLLNTLDEAMTAQTPRTEGAALKQGQSAVLPHLQIDAVSLAGILALSSLDGKNLSDSERMLLIFSTDALNSGFESSDDRSTLVALGTLPILIQTGEVSLRVKVLAGRDFNLWALGLDGARKEKIPVKVGADGLLHIQFHSGALPSGPTPFFELAVK